MLAQTASREAALRRTILGSPVVPDDCSRRDGGLSTKRQAAAGRTESAASMIARAAARVQRSSSSRRTMPSGTGKTLTPAASAARNATGYLQVLGQRRIRVDPAG